MGPADDLAWPRLAQTTRFGPVESPAGPLAAGT
jgi:hypothetical protein